MKVIFLDHDGVICLFDNYGSSFKKRKGYSGITNIRDIDINKRFDDFDQESIRVLNEILVETDVEIVVSSDWQDYANLEELGEYYKAQGIIKKPINTTRDNGPLNQLKYKNFPWHHNEELEQIRFLEITEWLERHPEVTHWVAVDDLHLGKIYKDYRGIVERKWGLTNFVWTPRIREGIKQTGIKERIIKYL